MTILRSNPICGLFESMTSDSDELDDKLQIFPLHIDFHKDEVLSSFIKKYEVLGILGTGVSGVVHECRCRHSDRRLAVKIVELVGEDETLKESTLTEVTILQQVTSHPYIIDLHEFFLSSTHILLVMELCKKELFDVLTEVVTISELRTRQIMRQLLMAVEFMHSENIAHRDIKAENIMIDSDNNVKLTDFGFASALQHDDELFSDLCGTFEYLAPELVSSQLSEGHPGFGKSIDLWACGVLMYTLMQGSSPFWAAEKAPVLRRILRGSFTFGHPIWREYSDPAKDMIMQLLKVDPAERLTATDALNHPFFFTSCLLPTAPIPPHPLTQIKSPRVRLKGVFLSVLITVFFKKFISTACVSRRQAVNDPYTVAPLRRLIDQAAFRIYGHWVTREPGRSRALLFQNIPYCDKHKPSA